MKEWKYKERLVLFLVCMLYILGPAVARPIRGFEFIENKNQWPYPIQYGTSVPGGQLFIQPGVFTYYFLDQSQLGHGHNGRASSETNEQHGPRNINGHRLQVSFDGANTYAKPLAIDKSKSYYNYFIGGDTCTWSSFAYAYNGVV